MAFRPGMAELIVVLVIILLLFGATRLPALGASLGKGIRAFRKSVGTEEEDTRKRRSSSRRASRSAAADGNGANAPRT